MKSTTFKKFVLLASAGVLLQAGGCGTLIVQLVANTVFTQVVRAIVDGILGTADAAPVE